MFTANENSYTSVTNSNGSITNKSATRTHKWEFDKDGQYISTLIEDATSIISTGKWNFTSGVGDAKNKSQIFFSQEKANYNNSQNTYTGNNIAHFYDIKELRNKKIVFEINQTEKSGGYDTNYTLEMELEAE